MTLIDDVKASLRSNNTIEVQDLIDSAKLDLLVSGVLNQDDTDPLIKRAITVYCKANYGYDDPNVQEKFEKSYESLKRHLSLSIEYAYYKIKFIVGMPQVCVTFNGETKYTNQSGAATFYIKQKDNVEYKINKPGYKVQNKMIDITSSADILVSLVEI